MRRYFLITVDTEGDNLWNYKAGDIVGTKNALYLPRFQRLCDEFGFKPVWLTNYEMAKSPDFISFVSSALDKESCELGIHIHAWNNPPQYELKRRYPGNPYLTEYPETIMREKFRYTYDLLKEKTGISVKSHRSGRWAMDERYFKILEEFGVFADCSFTPNISWKGVPGATVPSGSDYENVPVNSHKIGSVVEVPVTVRHFSHYYPSGSFLHRFKSVMCGSNIWLRPALTGVQDMRALIDLVDKEHGTDYLEFMVHSSELMPGGSPYAITENDIDDLYSRIKFVFNYVKALGFVGETLEHYASSKNDVR